MIIERGLPIIYYESRVINLKLDETTLKLIDKEYDLMAMNADAEVVQKVKSNWDRWKQFLEMTRP